MNKLLVLTFLSILSAPSSTIICAAGRAKATATKAQQRVSTTIAVARMAAIFGTAEEKKDAQDAKSRATAAPGSARRVLQASNYHAHQDIRQAKGEQNAARRKARAMRADAPASRRTKTKRKS